MTCCVIVIDNNIVYTLVILATVHPKTVYTSSLLVHNCVKVILGFVVVKMKVVVSCWSHAPFYSESKPVWEPPSLACSAIHGGKHTDGNFQEWCKKLQLYICHPSCRVHECLIYVGINWRCVQKPWPLVANTGTARMKATTAALKAASFDSVSVMDLDRALKPQCLSPMTLSKTWISEHTWELIDGIRSTSSVSKWDGSVLLDGCNDLFLPPHIWWWFYGIVSRNCRYLYFGGSCMVHHMAILEGNGVFNADTDLFLHFYCCWIWESSGTLFCFHWLWETRSITGVVRCEWISSICKDWQIGGTNYILSVKPSQ